MKRTVTALAILSAVCFFAGCARVTISSSNEAERRYLESWIKYYHPDAVKADLGYWVISEAPGSGRTAGDAEAHPFVRLNYTVSNLDGTIISYSGAETARQLFEYDKTTYYGDHIWNRSENALTSGVEDMISSMKEGGRKKAVIPGWLHASEVYGSAEEYYRNGSGTTSVYDFELLEVIDDIDKWQIDSIERYLAVHDMVTDSSKYGYYYHQTATPAETINLKSGDVAYVNYIGRLLNGTVFDTNVADTAKKYGLPYKNLQPMSINWADTYEELTAGSSSSSSSLIDGFAYCIFNMGKGEKGSCVFYSTLGYQSTGSGNAIPAYSPLRFDVELTEVKRQNE